MAKVKVNKRGFTIVELMIVMTIIAVLVVLVVEAIGLARRVARNTQRKSDLVTIQMALTKYYQDNKNYLGTNSGCGADSSLDTDSIGDGNGWFNANYGVDKAPMSQCLVNQGYLDREILDPSKQRSYGSTPVGGEPLGYAYMKYNCSNRVQIFARLEGVPYSTTATDGTCCSVCDQNYGMNYWVTLE